MTDWNPRPAPADFAPGSYLVARFAKLNKNATLEEYRDEVDGRSRVYGPDEIAWRYEGCRVQEVIDLPYAQYRHLRRHLLEDSPLFAGKGGTGSTWTAPEGWDYFTAPPEERDAFHAGAYRLVLVVGCSASPHPETFVVDPQGYSYARYVGLDPEPATQEGPK